MKFSSLVTPKVVKKTTFSAAKYNDENFVKMTTFQFLCDSWSSLVSTNRKFHSTNNIMAALYCCCTKSFTVLAWIIKQETCRSIKLRELSACGRFVSHTKATEHKCRMTAHGPSSTSQLRRPRMLRCHCLPAGSLHVLGAFGSLSKSHISFKVT